MKFYNRTFLFSLLTIGIALSNSPNLTYASEIKPSTYATVCPAMSGVSNLGAVDVTGSDGKSYKTYYARAFNSCSEKYSYYAGSEELSNIFYRTDYGGLVTYQHIPQKNYRQYTKGNNWHWGQLKENSDINATKKYYKYWGVKLNSIACRDVHESTCAFKLDKLHTNHEFYYEESTTLYRSKGGEGESRYLGYSANGSSVLNTYLPLDGSSSKVWSDWSKYPFDNNVFATSSNAYFKPTKSDYDNDVALKRKAIERLLNDMPELKKVGNVDSWMNRVSLRTNPITEAPIFEVTRDNGLGYAVIALPTPAEFNRNVSLVEMRIETVIDGKTYVAAQMKRNDNDGNVTVSFGQYNGKTIELEQGEKYKLKIVLKNTSPSRVSLTGSNYVSYNGTEYSHGSDLGYGKTQTIEIPYQAPNQATDTLYAKVGPSYGANNQQYQDDDASLTIKLKAKPKGDLKVVKAELIEVKTNQAVKYPVQGMEYYIKYYTKYEGEKMPDIFDINLRAEINTYQPSVSTGSLINKIVTTTLDSTPATTELTNGKEIVFQSGKFVATSSKITTSYTVLPPDYKYVINQNKGNDTGSATFMENFDIVVKPGSLEIQPDNYPGGDYCKPLVIKYQVAYNAPTGHNYSEAQKVKVAFNVGGKLAETTIQVYANQGYKEYSYTFNNGCVNSGSGTNVPVSLIVNPYHTIHESTYNNNKLQKDWVKKSYAKDYCSTRSREKNEWTQKYYIMSVEEAALGPDLDKFVGQETISIAQKETFKISSVQVYSKYMKDKNMGSNGWVELLNSDGSRNSIVPIIKAGYGFDMKITVEYETNAFTTESSRIGTLPKNKTLYARHVPITIEDDFYLALKKAGSSDVVISAKGGNNQGGTTVKVSSSSSGSATSKQKFVYKFENVKISEKTPDGTYQFALYTKPVVGVIDKTTGTSTGILCDFLNVSFKVNGSVYDDVITGTIK